MGGKSAPDSYVFSLDFFGCAANIFLGRNIAKLYGLSISDAREGRVVSGGFRGFILRCGAGFVRATNILASLVLAIG